MSASTRPGVAGRGSIANACGRWQGPPVACGRIRPRSRDRRQSRWTGSADPSPRRKCTRHRARDVGPATAAASRRGQSSPARGDLGSLRGLFHTEPATSGQRRPASASGSTRRPRSWRRRCGGQRRLARKTAQIGRGILFPPAGCKGTADVYPALTDQPSSQGYNLRWVRVQSLARALGLGKKMRHAGGSDRRLRIEEAFEPTCASTAVRSVPNSTFRAWTRASST